MLEMLKRLEEETPDVDEPNDEDTSDIDDDGVAASLTKRLADVDIGWRPDLAPLKSL